MNCVINKVKYHKGNESEYYTIKAIYNGIKLNITYDIGNAAIVVHEWYKLTQEQLNEVNNEIKKYIENNSEQ